MPYLIYFGGKMEFFILTKTFFMDKTKKISQKWLVKKLAIYFWAFKRCANFQCNPISLWRGIVFTYAGQTDRLS